MFSNLTQSALYLPNGFNDVLQVTGVTIDDEGTEQARAIVEFSNGCTERLYIFEKGSAMKRLKTNFYYLTNHANVDLPSTIVKGKFKFNQKQWASPVRIEKKGKFVDFFSVDAE